MDDYDASRSPDPAAWLALEDDERKVLVQAHHERSTDTHVPVKSPKLHAAMHVVAETQIASNDPPEASNALERLVREGLDRHEAIHAVASVSANELFQMMDEERPYDPTRVARGLDALSASTWSNAIRAREGRDLRPLERRRRNREPGA